MIKYAGLGAVMVCTAMQGVQAQSLRDFDTGGFSDTRATATITIPLGARRGSDEAAPRVEFSVDQRVVGSDSSVTPLRFDPDYQEQEVRLSSLSLTFEDNPRLLFNGSRVATLGPRLTADEEEGGGGLGTAGWVVLGAGALVGASFLFADFLKDDIEDAIRGED